MPAPTSRQHAWPTQILLIARDSVMGWVNHNASSLGAALAFYTLFSTAPILVIAMAIVGSVFGPHVAETRVLEQMRGLLGDSGATAVQTLLASAQQSHIKGVAAALSIVILLIGATSVFGELQNTLNFIWQSKPKKKETAWWRIVRARVLSVGL